MEKRLSKPYDCEVLVVGAGPAGATAARLLASEGRRVLLLDKKPFPRPKLCAGLLTWKTINLLQKAFGVSRQTLKQNGIIHHQTHKYAVCGRGGELIDGHLDYPFHYVDRTAYDHFWVDLARRAGAEVCLGEGVTGIDVAAGTVTTNRLRTLRARVILAADGAMSRIRRHLIKHRYISVNWTGGLALGIESIFQRREPSHFKDWPVIYLGFVPWGYAWSFPGGKHQTVGLCSLVRHSPKAIRRCYAEFLYSLGVPSTDRVSTACHPLPYGNYIPRGGHGPILLLGDACGLADPLLGEGMYYAHRSGQLAADAVLEAYPDWTNAQPFYERRLRNGLVHELRRIRIWRTLVFTVLSRSQYRPFALLMRRYQKRVEAMVQGRRSFGLRPSTKNL